MDLLIGTRNKSKFERYKNVLKSFGEFSLVSLHDFKSEIASPVETGLTAIDNAKIKARYYSEQIQILTLSIDDSLELLDPSIINQPGVKVRRFQSEVELSDQQLLDKFLAVVKNTKNQRLDIRWTFALCLRTLSGKEYIETANIENEFTTTIKHPIKKGYPLSSISYNKQIGKLQCDFNESDWNLYYQPLYMSLIKIISRYKTSLEI